MYRSQQKPLQTVIAKTNPPAKPAPAPKEQPKSSAGQKSNTFNFNGIFNNLGDAFRGVGDCAKESIGYETKHPDGTTTVHTGPLSHMREKHWLMLGGFILLAIKASRG